MPLTHAFILPHPPLAVPQVGKGEEKQIAATLNSYQNIATQIAALKPEVIVVTSPHAVLYADYFHISPGTGARGDFGRFGQPQVQLEVAYDAPLVRAIAKEAEAMELPAGTLGERDKALDHGVMVPLYYIHQQYTAFKLVRIGLSGLPASAHYQLGKCIAKAIGKLGRNAVFLASGDLSHKLTDDGPYGFHPNGPLFDKQVTEAMAEGDFLKFLCFDEAFCESAAECGLRSFQIMAGALDGMAVKPKLLSYEGPFGVGYGAATFEVIGVDENRHFDQQVLRMETARLEKIKWAEDAYVRLARLSLETYVRTGKRMTTLPTDLPEAMTTQRAGVFVSLKKEGQLRGCIGTTGPTTSSIAHEIVRNAVLAGCDDPRFDPVKAKELERLVYSVDVLGVPEAIEDKNQLDVKRYGVIVTNGSRSGLLLPNLDGVDTVEQQVQIALQKAGIRAKEGYRMQRFEVVRHK